MPSMYFLMCDGEFVTELRGFLDAPPLCSSVRDPPSVSEPSLRQLNPHFEATIDGHRRQHTEGRFTAFHGTPTEDLIADVVFPDEIAQELLVDPGPVDNLDHHVSSDVLGCRSSKWLKRRETYGCVPESAAQLNRLKQDRLGLFKGQVGPEAETDAHGPEAGAGNGDIAEGECLDHIV